MIEVAKPILTADNSTAQASLSSGDGVLSYSLTAYGQGFKRAGLEPVRQIHTGTSMTHGLERITATEKLADAWPRYSMQSTWRPVKGPREPVVAAMHSLPSKNDVVSLLQTLGSNIYDTLLLGPRIAPHVFVAGDGQGVSYWVRLKIDNKRVDETEVRLSFR